jgi:hypothetical protein
MQMLYGLMLSLGDERLTALLNWSFAALTALALVRLTRRHSPRPAGILAALLFFLTPATLYAASSSGADLGAGFYCALALFALLRMAEKDASARWPLCAGILLGLAMGMAYNVFPIAAVMAALAFPLGGERRVRKAFLVSGAAFLVLSPWLVKNIVFFGNPLYPVFSFFQKGSLGPTDLPGLIAVAAPRRPSAFLTVGGWKEFLLFPWTISESPMTMDNWPGPALLLLLPWMFLPRWRDARKTAALYALGAYLAWSVPNTVGRFILPALPLIACAAGLAVNDAAVPRWLRAAGWAGALAVCFFNFQAECHQGVVTQRWTSIVRRQPKAAFLNEEHLAYPLPSYSALDFMNKSLPPDAKVLFVGDARGFYCDRNFVAAGVYNSNPLWTAVKDASSAEDIRAALVRDGITHIFLNAKGLTWATSEKLLPLSAIQAPPFGDFWARDLDLLFEEREPRWLFVYALRARPKEKTDPGFLNPPRLVLQSLAAR